LSFHQRRDESKSFAAAINSTTFDNSHTSGMMHLDEFKLELQRHALLSTVIDWERFVHDIAWETLHWLRDHGLIGKPSKSITASIKHIQACIPNYESVSSRNLKCINKWFCSMFKKLYVPARNVCECQPCCVMQLPSGMETTWELLDMFHIPENEPISWQSGGRFKVPSSVQIPRSNSTRAAAAAADDAADHTIPLKFNTIWMTQKGVWKLLNLFYGARCLVAHGDPTPTLRGALCKYNVPPNKNFTYTQVRRTEYTPLFGLSRRHDAIFREFWEHLRSEDGMENPKISVNMLKVVSKFYSKASHLLMQNIAKYCISVFDIDHMWGISKRYAKPLVKLATEKHES
jgi:hypothetical protein